MDDSWQIRLDPQPPVYRHLLQSAVFNHQPLISKSTPPSPQLFNRPITTHSHQQQAPNRHFHRRQPPVSPIQLNNIPAAQIRGKRAQLSLHQPPISCPCIPLFPLLYRIKILVSHLEGSSPQLPAALPPVSRRAPKLLRPYRLSCVYVRHPKQREEHKKKCKMLYSRRRECRC